MEEATFGDTVEVSTSAPEKFRPGSLGEVVAITEVDAGSHMAGTDMPWGGKRYLVEFGDGVAAEVPEVWVRKVTAPDPPSDTL